MGKASVEYQEQEHNNHGHQGHGHHHGDLKGKKLAFSILLNVLITVAQGIGGLFSGSLSLMSDALHNFSDVIALVISYVADRLTKREFTEKETFGYKRAEIIAAFINAITLVAIAINLAWEAVSRFNQPVEIESSWVIILAGLSILVNGGSVLLLQKEASENMNLRSAYLHLLSDMVTSVAVLLGGVAMYFWKIYWIDSALSIMISLYLIYSSWGLLIQALRVLMQFAPAGVSLEEVQAEVLKFSKVENIHHVHLWQLNDQEVHLKAHLDFKEDLSLSEVAKITSQIQQIILDQFPIHYIVFQPEFGIMDSKQLVVDER